MVGSSYNKEMYLMPQNCTLKHDYNGSIMLLNHNKIKFKDKQTRSALWDKRIPTIGSEQREARYEWKDRGTREFG